MKKCGKPNYMKANAYRPITISVYVVKLLERTIERQIRHLCDINKLLDEKQEGLREVRNTTRYLYKLLTGLKESQRRSLKHIFCALTLKRHFTVFGLKVLWSNYIDQWQAS